MSGVKISFLGTGAGGSVHRGHTSIVVDSPDGSRVMLDASSGNTVFRNSGTLGMAPESFRHVLLSHDHADHMSGLPLIQLVYSRADPQGPPLEVHTGPGPLENVKLLCQVTTPGLRIDDAGADNYGGRRVYLWHPSTPGRSVSLGPRTHAASFPVDHIPGALGWRLDCDGMTVVFSGDTMFSPDLVKAAQGARLLIHETYGTEADRERAEGAAHCVAADAGKAAAQAGVAELILTHITNQYHADPQPLLDEARQHFDGPISVAHDLYQVEIN
jgi:ribonuclease BN (tRNA processing enzyme)